MFVFVPTTAPRARLRARPSRLWVVGLLAVLAPPGAAVGQPIGGLEISGGYGWYALGEFNDALRDLDQSVGTDFGTVKQGPAFGAFARLWPSPPVLLRLGVERLVGRASSEGVDCAIDGIGITVGGTWFRPPVHRVRLGLGLAVGIYQVFGELTGPGLAMDTRGNGGGVHGQVELQRPIGGRWSAHAAVGYRYARVDGVHFETRGSDIEADYSGALLRLSLAHDWR
jgi:hypothetical protein